MPKLVPGYKDEVKEKILETAWDVIIQKGIKDTTMDDFAAAMNCSKGALYNYYRNKEELLEEAIYKRHVQIQEELFARFSSGDFFENAGKYFDRELINAMDHIQVTVDLLAEGTRNERIAEALKLKYNGAIKSFAKVLNYLQEHGRINLKMDVEEAAKVIYALRTGVHMGMVSGLSKESARKIWIDGLKGIVSTDNTEK